MPGVDPRLPQSYRVDPEMPVDERTHEIEAALVGHWSHLGRWPPGALIDENGVLRYETPIPHLPYNGVIRTEIADGDPEGTIADVVGSFERRSAPFLWWQHPSCRPGDLGRRLERHGLIAVERVSGMSLELDGWVAPALPGDVEFVEALDTRTLDAYEELIVRYWELPTDAQEMVSSLNRFWGPGRSNVHRWVAYSGGRPVGRPFSRCPRRTALPPCTA